jgi:protein gp37
LKRNHQQHSQSNDILSVYRSGKIASKNEFKEITWNPATGCSKISPGCKNCYAEKMALRLQEIGQAKYAKGFELNFHPEVLKEPYTWKKRRIVFSNSMSDIFHEKMPIEYIKAIFKVMNENPRHIFQIITKRAERLADLASELYWSENIWAGVTIENSDYLYRADLLRAIPGKMKFLCIEPLIGHIERINLSGIDWVVAGGESGSGARPIKEQWVIDIRDECLEQNVPFCFKHWGGVNPKANGRLLEGQIWNEIPEPDTGILKI